MSFDTYNDVLDTSMADPNDEVTLFMNNFVSRNAYSFKNLKLAYLFEGITGQEISTDLRRWKCFKSAATERNLVLYRIHPFGVAPMTLETAHSVARSRQQVPLR